MRYTLHAQSLRIPFRSTFKHASASRAQTAAVWVRARADSGSTGYGEGCPRSYVTGESVETALQFIAAQQSRIESEVTDLSALQGFVRRERALIDAHPAAWCAVELALLDLFARERSISVEALLNLPAPPPRCRYSAVLGDADAAVFAQQLARYRAVGFTDFKVKLSGDPARDRERLARFTADERVRVDANNLWTDAAQAERHLRALDCPIIAVEEPLQAHAIDACAQLADALAVPVILDESFLRVEQLDRLDDRCERWIINLRVSKLGGLLRAGEIARRAHAGGLRCVIGAQVGETSLLTRAALGLVSSLGACLFAQEGAFGTQLLAEDVCDPVVMFGAAGVLDTTAVATGPGFGLNLRAEFA